jgi:diguanylate cyclase (GGDEF)-like protein
MEARSALAGDNYEVLVSSEENSGSRLDVFATLSQIPAHFWSTDSTLRITLGAIPVVSKDYSTGTSTDSALTDLSAHPANAERHTTMHQRALRGETVSYELREGDRAFFARVAPLRAVDGTIIGCVGAAVDITHRQMVMERLKELATTDSMTGLANYRRLIDCMELEIKRSERTKRPFSIVMLDLDGLKSINDTYGHLCGSRALCRVANALRSKCRATDLAARYGGDEFCLVLPETPGEGAANIAKRISDSLKDEPEVPPVSVSWGAATYPFHGANAEQLIVRADKQLYALKLQRHHR